MNKVHFTEEQLQLLQRVLYNELYVGLDDYKSIKAGDCEFHVERYASYCNNIVYNSIGEVDALFIIQNRIIKNTELLKKLLGEPAGSFDLIDNEVERLHDSIGFYLAKSLDGFMDLLYGDEKDLDITIWMPFLSANKEIRNWDEFLANATNLDFFEAEYEKAEDLQYYLRVYFPNKYHKSREEYNTYCDTILRENKELKAAHESQLSLASSN